MLSNFQNNSDILDCKNVTCLLAQCWNGSLDLALVVHVPTFVSIPVEADPETFPTTSLLRHKRDFGITAAIITAITISAATAVIAGTGMVNKVTAATVVNQISEKTSEALTTLQKVDAYLASGILLVNQRVDLLQAHVEQLTDVVQMSCVSATPHLGITPLRFMNDTFIQSHNLSAYLQGKWTRELDQMQQQLQIRILSLDGTRVDPVTPGEGDTEGLGTNNNTGDMQTEEATSCSQA
uniref:uncharacterized protein LOC143313659 n=1 Tax=Arvicanthis niloticus TaxID=61156 RepID=UPI00402BAF84